MRLMKRKGILMMLLIAFIFVMAACSSESSTGDEQSASTDNENNTDSHTNKEETGGTLKIALDASPPTLDQPTSTATATRDISRLIFESLVVTDSNFKAVPMLAESIDAEDNQTFTFHLRQGIKFHNGKEMIAEDVVASMERWMEKSTTTGNIFDDATWIAEDDYTVVLELKEASSLTLDTMASSSQAAGIMPKEIVESAPDEGVEEYIGTGPFKFVEWKQDQYIQFEKYEDYQPVNMKPDGLAGKKEALVDDIYVYIVPDPTTRLTGLQTGEYNFVHGLPYDMYEQLQDDPNIETVLVTEGNQLLGFNKIEGPASDFRMRQAINTGLNPDEIMMAAFPNKDLYWLYSGYMDKGIENWATDAGSEYYNQNDPEKAKQMLADMGYEGEEFVVITTRDYIEFYNAGIAIQEQLNQMGINAKLEVYDWPTLIDRRENDLSSWDAHITSTSVMSTPTQLLPLSPTWAGGVNDDHVAESLGAIETAPTLEEAQKLWDDLQLYIWEKLLPVAHLGAYNYLYGHSPDVQGVTTTSGPIYWNVTVSE